jgi:NADH:ubiquinone oxidoreductase subunit 5 (subunit L)/multisubunit Na+/H+ antiporter MnhA subunit
MFEQFSWLIPLLPWLAAGWIGIGYILKFNRGEAGEQHTSLVVLAATAGSLLLSLALAIEALIKGAQGQLVLGTWLHTGDIHLPLSFTLDTIGISLLLVVTLIVFLTMKFSVNYMHRESGYQRLFMLFCLFAGGMELIVMAGNALLAFVGWEIVGVTSYLLIGYAIDRPTATKNAVKVFMTNRVGDTGFIIGIALSLFWLGGVEWSQINSEAGSIETLLAGVVAGGFVLAALVKSAQLPFAPWIAQALEGPTPSSAIFYSSLMVHAGVILLIRLAPLLEQAPVIMITIAILGLLTVLYGWLSGLTQSDIKSSLMFATTSQVGLMFFWCGMGWFTLAAWHLGLHAVWRLFQFLASPALVNQIDHATPSPPPWLTRWRWLHNAALQRFWLDALSDALLVRPTVSLAKDVQFFDEQVVTRVIGLPVYSRSVSSLTQWEAIQKRRSSDRVGTVSQGTGLAGKFITWLANILYWFESHLVLRGGGEGLLKNLHRIGGVLERVEQLLSTPRYLIVLVVITFVVIL